ncbi:DUF6645 domain-containing protein [Escherichia coli]
MAFKHYDVVRASSPSDLAGKLTQKLKEGWQPYGSPIISNAGYGAEFIQAIVAEGDMTSPVVSPGGDGTRTVVVEPEYYFVIALAGQSNGMAYGEGLPLPETYDRPDPRIKQLARRSTVTPGGAACAYNDIIPADHCLHDVQDLSRFSHPKASAEQYGCVGQGLHIAKKLLPFMPENAGILLVPCCRGGSAFTAGADGTFSESSGASDKSERWGVDKPLYKDLLTRTQAALKANPKNILLCVVWMQGEFDLKQGAYASQPAMFDAMVEKYRSDLAGVSGQCAGASPSLVPWICGDTTYYWKETYSAQYDAVYGAYKTKAGKNIFFVPFMMDDNGQKVGTNEPSEDPDIPAIGYYGSGGRTDSKSWTTSDRKTHFGSWARRGIISDRLATAILLHVGRVADFVSGKVTKAAVSSGGGVSQPAQESGDTQPESVVPTKIQSVLAYDANAENADLASQGWTLTDVKNTLVSDSGSGKKALRLEKPENGLAQKKTWKVSHAIDAGKGKELFDNGGEITLRFKIPDDVSLNASANQYSAGIYWRGSGWPGAESEEGYIAAFYLQTDKTNINVMYHANTTSQRLGSYGPFDHDWHTLTFRFPGGGSLNVTPVLDNAAGKPFTLTRWTNAAFEANALAITDITGNAATYPVLIESLTVGVNAVAA